MINTGSNTDRNRRAVIALGAALAAAAVIQYGFPGTASSSTTVVSANNAELARQRLERTRQIAASLPMREAAMKQATADLNEREHGIIQADTAAQAQAVLLEVASRVGKAEQLDVRGGDLSAPKAFGDYGLVYATFTFECHIEQLVNFLADLQKEPQLIAPVEERIAAANAKDKTMTVRMVLAGVVPRKLVPEKKGSGVF